MAVFAHARRRSPDVGIDGGLWRLLRVDQQDRKRENIEDLPTREHWHRQGEDAISAGDQNAHLPVYIH